jgi:hypothetical protein
MNLMWESDTITSSTAMVAHAYDRGKAIEGSCHFPQDPDYLFSSSSQNDIPAMVIYV